MKRLSLVFLLLFLSAFQTNGAGFATDVTEIEGFTKSNEIVKIVIKTVNNCQSNPYYEGFGWGIPEWDDDPESQYIISNIKVFVDNKEVFIPLSVYCDLGNPYGVSFKSETNQFSLVILGGDTGTSYKAELVFEQLPNTDYLRNRIKYRKVSSKEFPDEVWEKTEYSFIIDDGR